MSLPRGAKKYTVDASVCGAKGLFWRTRLGVGGEKFVTRTGDGSTGFASNGHQFIGVEDVQGMVSCCVPFGGELCFNADALPNSDVHSRSGASPPTCGSRLWTCRQQLLCATDLRKRATPLCYLWAEALWARTTPERLFRICTLRTAAAAAAGARLWPPRSLPWKSRSRSVRRRGAQSLLLRTLRCSRSPSRGVYGRGSYCWLPPSCSPPCAL